jgi:hypothetical protein
MKKSGPNKLGSEMLIESHPVKVLQAAPVGKGDERSQMIDDRSRQQTRRSRIHSCREISRGLEFGMNNRQGKSVMGERRFAICLPAPLALSQGAGKQLARRLNTFAPALT